MRVELPPVVIVVLAYLYVERLLVVFSDVGRGDIRENYLRPEHCCIVIIELAFFYTYIYTGTPETGSTLCSGTMI